MSVKSSIQVILLTLLTVSLTLQAQPGPPPGVRPPPASQGVPNQPPPRVHPNHPALNIPGPIARLPRGAQELSHQGNPVFHHDGEFFSPQGSGFRTIAPPIGVELNRIPNRAKRVSRDIYRFNDVYYEKVGFNQYRVTNAP